MFDSNGDYVYEHDLESGAWDGHSYDCPSPSRPCACDPEAGLAWLNTPDEDDAEDADDFEADAIDYATYISSR